jgi:hypothetical protein
MLELVAIIFFVLLFVFVLSITIYIELLAGG